MLTTSLTLLCWCRWLAMGVANEFEWMNKWIETKYTLCHQDRWQPCRSSVYLCVCVWVHMLHVDHGPERWTPHTQYVVGVNCFLSPGPLACVTNLGFLPSYLPITNGLIGTCISIVFFLFFGKLFQPIVMGMREKISLLFAMIWSYCGLCWCRDRTHKGWTRWNSHLFHIVCLCVTKWNVIIFFFELVGDTIGRTNRCPLPVYLNHWLGRRHSRRRRVRRHPHCWLIELDKLLQLYFASLNFFLPFRCRPRQKIITTMCAAVFYRCIRL